MKKVKQMQTQHKSPAWNLLVKGLKNARKEATRKYFKTLEYSVVDVKFYDYDRTNWSKLEPKTDNELTNEEEEAEKEDLLVEIDPNEVKMLELIWEL
ncbi:hypothetical protein JHK85_004522 [Glycine max]|nr:hypothetical protein JHK85_004522 [Glycine max]